MQLSMEKAMEMMREENGDLRLSGTDYTELPEGLTVRRTLNLEGSRITALPRELKVYGDILAQDSSLAVVPEDLVVYGALWVPHSKVAKIPASITVGHDLSLEGCPIKELPDNLTIPGSLWIANTPIQRLPHGLAVGEALDVSYLEIHDLPSDTKVGMYVQFNVEFLNHNRRKYKDRRACDRFYHGEYVPGRYLYVDGMLVPVKRTKKFGKYTVFVAKTPNHFAPHAKIDQYIMTDGYNFSYYGNFHEMAEELEHMREKQDEIRRYHFLSLSDSLPTDEMLEMYRDITTMNEALMDQYLEGKGQLKESYTVQETIDLFRTYYVFNQSFIDFFTDPDED